MREFNRFLNKLGWSHEFAAKKLGISLATIRKWEQQASLQMRGELFMACMLHLKLLVI